MNFKGTLFNPGYHPTKAFCGTKLSDIMAQGKSLLVRLFLYMSQKLKIKLLVEILCFWSEPRTLTNWASRN